MKTLWAICIFIAIFMITTRLYLAHKKQKEEDQKPPTATKTLEEVINELHADKTREVWVGKVTDAYELWVKNGAGYITIVADDGKMIEFCVIGFGSPNETKRDLVTVEYVHELIGKRVEIIRNPEFKHGIIAKSIKELDVER